MITMSSLSSTSSSPSLFSLASGQFDDKMPMVSVPWSQPASVVVILLGEHISEGTALNLSYSISFLGPLLLGGLVWEILTIDVAFALQSTIECFLPSQKAIEKDNRLRSSSNQSKDSVQSQVPLRKAESKNLIFSSFIEKPQSDEKQKDERTQNDDRNKSDRVKILSILKQLCSFLARASALALIALYIAYTHGDHHIQCGSWPHTIAALGATATSMINLSIFVNAFIVFPKAPQWLFLLLSVFALAQLGMSFATIAAWKGGLRLSGVACYLRISRWSGILHLANLIFLVILPFFFFFRASSTRDNNVRNGHKHKTSAISGNKEGHGDIIPGALSNAFSILNLNKLTRRNRLSSVTATGSRQNQANMLQNTFPSQPDQVKDWIAARLATTNDFTSTEEDQDRQRYAIQPDTEGILMLPGRIDSSYGSTTHTFCVSEPTKIWTNYIIWWFIAFCTALCGTVISFANWSAILTFSYYPVSILLFVLFCQRLTISPKGVYVTGQRVNLTDFNRFDEEHRRNRLGSSPMSIRLAAAASTLTALNAEDVNRRPRRSSSTPRRASAADATAAKFREIFPTQQKSLRNSLERSFSTRKAVPTDYARDAISPTYTPAENVIMAEEKKANEEAQEEEGEDFASKLSNAVGTLVKKSSNFSLKTRIVQLMRESSGQGRPNSAGNGSDLEDGLGNSFVHEDQQDPLMKLAAQGLASSVRSSATHPNRVSPSTKRSSGSSSQPAIQPRSPQESSMEDVNNQLHDEKLSRNLLKFNFLTERKTRKSSPAMLRIRPNLDRRHAGALDISMSPPRTTSSTLTLADDQSTSRHARIWSGSSLHQSEDTLWTSLTDDESQYKQGLQPRYRQRSRVLSNGPVRGRMYEVDALVSPNFQYAISNDTAHASSDHASTPNSPVAAMQSEESEKTLPIPPQMTQKSFAAAKPLMPMGYRSTTLSPMLEVNERPSSVMQHNGTSANAFNQLSTMRKGPKNSSNNRNRSGSVSNTSQDHQATYDTFGHYGIVSIDSVPGIASLQSTNDVPLVIPNDSPGVAQAVNGRDRGLSNPNSISSVMLIGHITATSNSTKSDVETSSRIQTISNNSIAGKEGQESKSSSSKKVPSSEAESSSSSSPSVYHSPVSSIALAVAQDGVAVPLQSGTSNSILSTRTAPLAAIDSLQDVENEEEMENLKSNDSRFVDTDLKVGKEETNSKLDKTEQFLQQAKVGDSINLSDDVDIDQQPDWVVADEKLKERENKHDQALKAGIEMADEDILSIFLDKRGFSRGQTEELNAHRNERRRKRLSKEAYSMRSAPTAMERILSGGTVSTFHQDGELSYESESSASHMQDDRLSHAKTSPTLDRSGQDHTSEVSFGLNEIANNPKIKEKSYRPLSPTSQKSSSRKKSKQKQKERSRSPDDLQIRTAEAVVQAAPHRSSLHLQRSVEDLMKAAKENISPLIIPSAIGSPHGTKSPSPMDQIEMPILERQASFGQATIGAISVDSDSSRGIGPKRQIYIRQSSGSHSTFGSDKRNHQSSSSNSGSAAVSEHGESISGRSPMTGMGERGGIDMVKKHVLPKINPRSSPVVTPQSALIALAGPPSHPPNIPLPPPPPEAEMKPKDLSPISGNSMAALSTNSLNNQRILTRVEEDSDDSRPSTPEMAAKAKAIVKQKRVTPQRNESSTSIYNSAKEDDSIAESSAYESDEKLPGKQKRFKSKQRRD